VPIGDHGLHAGMRGEQPGLSRAPARMGLSGTWLPSQREWTWRSPVQLAVASRAEGTLLIVLEGPPGNAERAPIPPNPSLRRAVLQREQPIGRESLLPTI